MKKSLLSIVALAVALAVALPVRAEDQAKPEKPKQHQFTGEITKVDAAGKSVTLKNSKGEEKTFTLADKAKISTKEKEAAELSDLKVGDKVTAHYTEQDGKNLASKINPPAPKKTDKPAQ
jgi:Cu/Ag efflux protein CusF